MKTPSKKLTLKKESLKRLGDAELKQAAGGAVTWGCTSRPTVYEAAYDPYAYNFQYDYNFYYYGY